MKAFDSCPATTPKEVCNNLQSIHCACHRPVKSSYHQHKIYLSQISCEDHPTLRFIAGATRQQPSPSSE